MSPRKGARRMADIPPAILAELNAGRLETVNLVEYLAVDPAQLLTAVLADLELAPDHPALAATRAELPTLKPMQRHRAIARGLSAALADDPARQTTLAGHRSDLVRQWAALMVGLQPFTSLTARLTAIRTFAADRHFGVREMAWLAVRSAVIAELPEALERLTPWVQENDANLRRFASELTRPRGVWCAHITALKADPAAGLPLLEPLKADPSRYVQDSVANWLNDAGKSQPDWVMDLCARWSRESNSKPTQYICRRATRFHKGRP